MSACNCCVAPPEPGAFNTIEIASTQTRQTGETTAALIARTIATLPSWPAWPVTPDSFKTAHRSQIGNSCTIRRIRWRLEHPPTVTCYAKWWMRTSFEGVSAGNPPVLPAPVNTFSEYEWTGTGILCMADTSKSVDDQDNKIIGSYTEVDEPATDGTIYISAVKWSYLVNYEPDISDNANLQSSGFPNPAWVA